MTNKIVGNCPSCGAPIYSGAGIWLDGRPPKNTYSCECRKAPKMQSARRPLIKHGSFADLLLK